MTYGPIDKYPDEIKTLPYVDWEKVLGTATIVSSSWTSSSTDLDFVSASYTDTRTQVRLTGGVGGTTYVIENQVTLSDGQVRIIQIEIDVLVDDVP